MMLKEILLPFLKKAEPAQIPAPTRSAKEFSDWVRSSFKDYNGWFEGVIPASEFVTYNIENWQRQGDPRLAAIEKTLSNKTGIQEPIHIGQPDRGRAAVTDGGHRATAAVQYWLRTGRDISIPFLFHSRKKKYQ